MGKTGVEMEAITDVSLCYFNNMGVKLLKNDDVDQYPFRRI